MIEGIPMMGPFAQSVGTIDYPWMSINIFLGFAAIAAMALVGLAAVSYTHLDVYKRQSRMSRQTESFWRKWYVP